MERKEINLFEAYASKKQQLFDLVQKAYEYEWISAERKEEIRANVERSVLTIGVIGQMKCGKSTFLNSFVFGKELLPAATTPMTAALSVITYGEKEQLTATFYTKEEWEEQLNTSKRSLKDVEGDTLEESKIKAAQDLVKSAQKIGGKLESLLGKTVTDKLENLEEYVGAEGTYVAITKSVEISYPADYLKGVRIVDTPGFNDPIVSREERTRAFLREADVVVMLLYAGRPFDATDRDILFNNVKQCGVGKIVVAVNKYDVPYENGETEQQIVDYVKKEIGKACREYGDESINELLNDITPIPISAQMALLSMLPMEEINNDEALGFSLRRHYNNFEISSQKELYEKSFVENLYNAISHIIEVEKEDIILRKPLNSIISVANIFKTDVDKDLLRLNKELELLSISDDEVLKKQNDYNNTIKRVEKRIEQLENNLYDGLRLVENKWYEKFSKMLIKCKEAWRTNAEKKRYLWTKKKRKSQFRIEVEKDFTNKIAPEFKVLTIKIKPIVERLVNDFVLKIERILRKNNPDFSDEDIDALKSSVQAQVTKAFEEWEGLKLDELLTPNNGFSLDRIFIVRLISQTPVFRTFSNFEQSLLESADTIVREMDKHALESRVKIQEAKKIVIESIGKSVFDDFLKPLVGLISELKENVELKKKRLEETKVEILDKTAKKDLLAQQTEEFEALAQAFYYS